MPQKRDNSDARGQSEQDLACLAGAFGTVARVFAPTLRSQPHIRVRELGPYDGLGSAAVDGRTGQEADGSDCSPNGIQPAAAPEISNSLSRRRATQRVSVRTRSKIASRIPALPVSKPRAGKASLPPPRTRLRRSCPEGRSPPVQLSVSRREPYRKSSRRKCGTARTRERVSRPSDGTMDAGD